MKEKDYCINYEELEIGCIDDSNAYEGAEIDLVENANDIGCVDDSDFPEGPKHSKHYDASDIECIDE